MLRSFADRMARTCAPAPARNVRAWAAALALAVSLAGLVALTTPVRAVAQVAPSTIGANGASAFSYSDLKDVGPKYSGGYASFSDTATAIYSGNPHGGYDTTTNKCKVCHAVHRATGSYELLRAQSQADACEYCHVGSAHSVKTVYGANASGVHTSVGHAIGYTGPIPDSTVAQSLETTTVTVRDASGGVTTTTVVIRASAGPNRVYRLTLHHSQTAAGGYREGYQRVGPTALTCMSCHAVHGAPAELWRPRAFPSNDATLAAGYKLLRASPSGSIQGPDGMAYDGTRTVSYTRDGMIGGKTYIEFGTTGLVNAGNVVRAVEATIGPDTVGPGRTIWDTRPFPVGTAPQTPAGATAGVNQYALSAWCADCHNLSAGEFTVGSVDQTQTVFATTPDAGDGTEVSATGATAQLVKTLSLDLSGLASVRVRTSLRSDDPAEQASLEVRIGATTVTHSTESTGYVDFTDEVQMAPGTGTVPVTLWLRSSGATATAWNATFDLFRGVTSTTTLDIVADTSVPAHETTSTHTSPMASAGNGPGQCFTCHRAGLSVKPAAPAYDAGRASCERCHYGTGSFATDPARLDPAGDFPHSADDGSAFLLGAWTMDAQTGAVTSETITAADTSKVCLRCHIPGKRTHAVVPRTP